MRVSLTVHGLTLYEQLLKTSHQELKYLENAHNKYIRYPYSCVNSSIFVLYRCLAFQARLIVRPAIYRTYVVSLASVLKYISVGVIV